MAKGELQGLLGFSNEVHKAIDALDFRALTSLLEDGTDLSEPDEQGRTPLHAAAEVAGLLIGEEDAESRSEVDVDQGLKALKMLMRASDNDAVRVACKKLNAQGFSALHLLVQARQAHSSSSPVAALRRVAPPIVQDCHREGIALLLQSGADPNVCARGSANEYNSGDWGRRGADGGLEALSGTSGGATALHMAIDCDPKSNDSIQLLLEHHAGMLLCVVPL